MQILITGKSLKVTDAMEAYINKKVNALEKFFPGIIRADVIVGEESKHHVKSSSKLFVECKLEVPGYDVFARKEATKLYEAIDLMQDYLKMELKKYKSKTKGSSKKNRSAGRSNKEYKSE